MSNIITTHEAKPIPDRRFDWQATFDDYEPGDVIGYGSTEAEAIADLQAQKAAADDVAAMLETWHELIDALRACHDYLSDIPESAAGGDDEAVKLTRAAAEVLLRAEGE